MSAGQWRKAATVHDQLALAARLWLCPACHNTRRLTSGRFHRHCWSCAGSPKTTVLTLRKQRLIACGVCRFLGDELTGEPAFQAVEVAERFADGLATPAELAAAHSRATAPAAYSATLPDAWEAVTTAVPQAVACLGWAHKGELDARMHQELTQVLVSAEANYGHLGRGAVKAARKSGERRIRAHFAELFDLAGRDFARALAEVPRDVLGDPFDPVRLDPGWLLADGGRVRQVAQAIYDAGTFEDMPVLADALQDAGCGDARLLDHCLRDRHYRGCWLLDLLLGKE